MGQVRQGFLPYRRPLFQATSGFATHSGAGSSTLLAANVDFLTLLTINSTVRFTLLFECTPVVSTTLVLRIGGDSGAQVSIAPSGAAGSRVVGWGGYLVGSGGEVDESLATQFFAEDFAFATAGVITSRTINPVVPTEFTAQALADFGGNGVQLIATGGGAGDIITPHYLSIELFGGFPATPLGF